MRRLIDIATMYNMSIEDVTNIFNHYMSKDMKETKAMYYTQLACASLAEQSGI